jgi:hypothetical protein
MTGYSHSYTRVFQNLDPKNIVGLLEVLSSLRLPKRPLVESRYSEHWRHFEHTLSFLKSIGWVTESGGQLLLTDRVNSSPFAYKKSGDISRSIVEAILQSDSSYRSALCRYLDQFRVNGTAIVHSPTSERRLKESSVRNFLSAVGMISYRRRQDDYIVQEEIVDLWIWARGFSGPKTKSKLRARIEERERIGTSAEDVAVEYERARLGKDWANHVHHIARDYPLASYDIKSVTLSNDRAVARFIEVKAVSPQSFRFFWSREEVEAARLLHNAYFLYLIPAQGDRTFDIGGIWIVDNAYDRICNSDQWAVESDVLLCQPTDISSSKKC